MSKITRAFRMKSVAVLALFGGVMPSAAQVALPGAAPGGGGYSGNPGMTLPTAPGAEPVPGNYYYPTTPQKSGHENINPRDDDGPSLRSETKKGSYSKYLNVPDRAPGSSQ
jgi:hypothetical protein